MTNVTEGATMTTEEAGRLATGLVGAAAAERDEWIDVPRPSAAADRWDVVPPPVERTFVGSIDLHLRSGAPVAARPYDEALSPGGWATVGPVHIHGEWDVLEAAFVAALDAVRAARQGPVGA